MNNDTLAKLDSIGALIWKSADTMRGNMDASEYRGPLLGLQCYSFLSNQFEKEAEIFFGKGTSYKIEWEKATDEEKAKICDNFLTYKPGYFFQPEYLFSEFVDQAKKGVFKASTLSNAINAFDNTIKTAKDKNRINTLYKLFEMINVDSSSTGSNPAEKNQMFSELIKNIDLMQKKVDALQEENKDIDVMAYIYEYLLARFASSAGKKGGEFLTPACISKLLSKLVLATCRNPKNIKSVYDPTCGTLSLVNSFIEELRRVDKTTADNVKIYGQEKNSTTAKLAGINMLYHNVSSNRFCIFNADTLTDDRFKDVDGKPARASIGLSNPPYALPNPLTDEYLKKDDRFLGYSRMAPKKAADYAFVMHLISHYSTECGAFGIVLPHGVLFRGAAEAAIRKDILNLKNKNGFRTLCAVVGVPNGMFYGTGIPTCLLIFSNEKTDDDVIFIDASKDFVKGKQNYFTDEQIDKIVKIYKEKKDVSKFCHVAKFDEIVQNNYNLNIPRYVDTSEDEEEIDIEAVLANLETLDKEIEASKAEIISSLKDLKILK